ncbi:MAG: hypothetical protein MRJ92_00515 [Nitrospira sp.]|nr:hypothetical protein [Nitrospira sp.]
MKKTVEPELNMIQQEMKMVEQDFESSMEAEEQINHAASGVTWGRRVGFAKAGLIPIHTRSTAVKGGDHSDSTRPDSVWGPLRD